VFLESRYLSVNEIIKSLGGNVDIIEIASGLSARSLEWPPGDYVYIETDLPGMLAKKQYVFNQILSETGKQKNPGHHFYPLNALDYAGWDSLGKKFFSSKKRNIAVIHEGLANYLSREEKERLRDNIAKFFGSFAANGFWITPDFYPYGNRHKTWITKMIDRRIEKKTQRKYSHFSGQQEVTDFLSRAGFQSDFISSSHVSGHLTCVSKMHLDRVKSSAALERYKTCIARYNV